MSDTKPMTAQEAIARYVERSLDGRYRMQEAYIFTYLSMTGFKIEDLELVEDHTNAPSMTHPKVYLRRKTTNSMVDAAPLMFEALKYYRDECSGAEPSLSVFERKLDEALAIAERKE